MALPGTMSQASVIYTVFRMHRISLYIITFISFLNVKGQDSLFQEAEYQFKLAKYQEAFDIFKEAGEGYYKVEKFEDYVLSNIKMALCFSRLAAYQQSIELSKNTLEFVNEVLPNDSYLKAETLRVQGDALLNLGRNAQAQEKLLLSEELYPENAEAEKAEAFNLLGVIYWNNANKDLSLQYHNQSLEIRKNVIGIESLEVADSYNNIGLIYLEEDGLQAGIYFTRALNIYEDILGTIHPKVAFTLINLARARSNQGINTQAVELIQRVQQIWENLYNDDHPNKSFTTSTLGQIYENEGDYDQALHFQELALKQYIKLFGDKHPEVANTYFLMAGIYQKTENYKTAVSYYQQAIFANLPDQYRAGDLSDPVLNNYLNPDYLLSAMLGKAKALEALHFEKTLKAKHLKAAIRTYSIADSLVSEIRRIRVTERDKIRLADISRLIYKNGIRLSLILGDQPFHSSKYNEWAFRFCERSKSSVLLEAIQETKAKSYSGIPENIISYEDSLKSELAFYQQKIAAGENTNENKTALFNYQQAYRDHIRQLEGEYPKYYSLKYESPQLDIDVLQQNLPVNSVLLSYYDAEDTIYQFILSKDRLRVESKKKSSTANRSINALRNSIKYQVDDSFDQISREMYTLLIPQLPRNINQLILIPDGILNTIPFETLINPESSNYLIEEFAISYDYSANLLLNRSEQDFEESSKEVLLLAPVDFSECSIELSPLPGTEAELREIKLLFNSNDWKVHPYLKKDASEEFIKSNGLDRFRYMHFATHGLVNESQPELSQIFLFPNDNEDGSLYSGDIYNLKINAELVSLSACETGLGQVVKGEGIVGLSRALLYAGAQNLMVSLWQVSDNSTAELMIEFYRQHLFYDHVRSFSEALRQAKIQMIRSDTYYKPYFWAPFILVGS